MLEMVKLRSLQFKTFFNHFSGPDRKKNVRINTEFSRSVSVPVDKVNPRMLGHSSAPNQTPTSPETDLATTPSLDSGEPGTQDPTERRNSSGTLLSPEVDAGTESDGFYMLKKDSQRRTTLAKVLAQDGHKICELWMQKVRDKYLGETVLTLKHLYMLLDGLKAFLTDQDPNVVETTIKQLKEELYYDAAAINQLQFAIYLFQESVIEVLRQHQIKPHWMFALDNLVRSCAQAAITVLAPELAENLANHSSPSTVNSSNSSKSNDGYEVNKIIPLKAQNSRLFNELLEAQKQYQSLVKQLLEVTRQNTENLEKALKCHCTCYHQENVEEDVRLANWLRGLGINESSQRKFVAEGYTLDEVLYSISRQDLHNVGLRGAYEFRIWRAIEQHRDGKEIILHNGEIDETGTV